MLFEAFIINIEISTNRLIPYLLGDWDSSYYHLWGALLFLRMSCHLLREGVGVVVRYGLIGAV
jgi:hypothetical protein